MNLAPYLAVRRARFFHAAAFYDDSAMEHFMAEHSAALSSLPPCRNNADALAVVEELSREGQPDDMGADGDRLRALLADYHLRLQR